MADKIKRQLMESLLVSMTHQVATGYTESNLSSLALYPEATSGPVDLEPLAVIRNLSMSALFLSRLRPEVLVLGQASVRMVSGYEMKTIADW